MSQLAIQQQKFPDIYVLWSEEFFIGALKDYPATAQHHDCCVYQT
jgi:hypothetical protein